MTDETSIFDAETNQTLVKTNDVPGLKSETQEVHMGEAEINDPSVGTEEIHEPILITNEIHDTLVSTRQTNELQTDLKSLKELINQPKEILCPVEGCDSSGHLNGVSYSHKNPSSCPVYHKMTTQECVSIANRYYQTKENQLYRENDLNDFVFYENEKINQTTTLYPEVFGNIKNLSIQFIENLLTTGLAQTPSTTPNSVKVPTISELKVSKWEFDLFKVSIVLTADEPNVPNQNVPNQKSDLAKKLIQFGDYEIEAFYLSPYPEEIWQSEKIHICHLCLSYSKSSFVLKSHLRKCLYKNPPGIEIYRKNTTSIFEVDGQVNKIYCQNLCLLSKLFLETKTLYYAVDTFIFYVLTEFNKLTNMFEIVGYFSKEKQSPNNYNLSCILVLPPFMGNGYGRMLIDFSYLLSRVENKIGSPERPLSDLGLVSYRSYWISVLLNYVSKHIDQNEISVKDISHETGIHTNDIIHTFQYIGMIKYWRGKYLIVKDVVS